MRSHFVQYHNEEVEGPLRSRRRSGRPLGYQIVSRKAPSGVDGAALWLVLGRGDPRSYYLAYVFEVASSGPLESAADDDFYQYYCRGTSGATFKPMLPLTDYPWFTDLLSHQSHFSFGLNTLHPYHVQELLSMTRGIDPFLEPFWADFIEARTIRHLNPRTGKLEGTFRPLKGRPRSRRTSA